ncbi:MAG: phosphopantothenoylcysteine decarboxylase [Opitutales bacterium]
MNASPIRCLITAGPTREFIDPVRYLSNPSTGKMGFALAEAACAAGWTVDLVSGPVCLREPEDAILYPVVTGEEMFHQTDALFDACDILIMTAAVMDFRPVTRHAHKVKKDEAELSVAFERTRDILSTLTERKERQRVVGFAAETRDVETYALRKLSDKRMDYIVANDVGPSAEGGFGAERNAAILLGADGTREAFALQEKRALADQLIARFAKVL